MEGISFRVKSKQNFIYNLIIRDNTDWNGLTWVADFEVQANDDEFQTIMLPWSSFCHKNSQFKSVKAPKDGMNLKNIYSISFMLCYWKEFARSG